MIDIFINIYIEYSYKTSLYSLTLYFPRIFVFIINLYYYSHNILLQYQIIIIDNYKLSYF